MNKMIYINLFCYPKESVIMRGYKTKEAAKRDTCDINDLYYLLEADDYFDFSIDLKDIETSEEEAICHFMDYYLDILEKKNVEYHFVYFDYKR